MAADRTYNDALPADSELGRYRLQSVLGQGSFGITYRGRDTTLLRDVAIKEYLPTELAMRRDESVGVRMPGQERVFNWGSDRFLKEAQALAKFKHPSIVNIYDYFPANGTAYLVMELLEGVSFASVLKGRDRPDSFEKLWPLIESLLGALEVVHKANLLHRDIKPDNIIIRTDAIPVLIDFGAARQWVGTLAEGVEEGRERSSTIPIFTKGYAPIEQCLNQTADFGPPTDIYALGALLYRIITGTRPLESPARFYDDQLRPAVVAGAGRFPEAFLRAIDWALRLRPENRPQDVVVLKRALLGEYGIPEVRPVGTGPVSPSFPTGGDQQDHGALPSAADDRPTDVLQSDVPVVESPGERRSHRGRTALLVVLGCGVMVLAASGWLWWNKGRTPWPFAFAQVEASVSSSASSENVDGKTGAEVGPLVQEEADRKAKTPGTVFRDCPNCPEMVVIPPGTFMMGSPDGEPQRMRWEGPQHQVTIGASFAMSRYDVTFTEWDSCVVEGGCNHYTPRDQGWGRGRRPVINVSWSDALAYTEWLLRKTGEPYRLPSEAEWEYAARAGTTTPFSWGNTITPDQANYDGTSAYNGGTTGVYRKMTAEVGGFPANWFGLHDMAGNVWQWVEDTWHDHYQGAPSDGSAWITEDSNSSRVVRGGSWFNVPRNVRSACRFDYSPNFRNYYVGFRVARPLSQ
jgi:formylglycine-generating enzyme required for sulfatase activity